MESAREKNSQSRRWACERKLREEQWEEEDESQQESGLTVASTQ